MSSHISGCKPLREKLVVIVYGEGALSFADDTSNERLQSLDTGIAREPQVEKRGLGPLS
jgi:hypothetical protein